VRTAALDALAAVSPAEARRHAEQMAGQDPHQRVREAAMRVRAAHTAPAGGSP
jgi:hypothetical protein